MWTGGWRRAQTTGALGVIVILALIIFHGNEFGQHFLGLSALQSRDLFWWSLLVLLLLYVRIAEHRSFSSIGFRRPGIKTVVAGVAFAIVLIFGVNFIAVAIIDHFQLSTAQGNAAANAIDTTPYWYRVVVIARGSISEEVVFRGYLIERISELTGSRISAAAVSVVAFSLAHLGYWGWVPLIFVTLAGIVAAIQYLWLRDLTGNIISHYLTDAAQMLV